MWNMIKKADSFKTVTANGKDFSILDSIAKLDDDLIVYGCGVNGEIFCSYLGKHGKSIKCFCDRQAEKKHFSVLGYDVISPGELFDGYRGEKIIVSPDNNSSIATFLVESGIPVDNILIPFHQVEYEVKSRIYAISEENCSEIQLVTVFTILYDTPKELLERTICSVLAQEEKRFTYLIIDNGSTDGSGKVVEQYAAIDSRIKLVTLDKNVPWTSEALLRTLKDNIKTKYVCMVDSDDYYEPSFLGKALALADNTHSDVVQVNTLTYSEDEQRYSYFNHCLGGDRILRGKEILDHYLLRIYMVTFWGKLYASDLFIELLEHMLEYPDKERDDIFRLDIAWMTFIAIRSKSVYLCDELLHVRTWRSGSSETSTGSMIHWLNSMTWSFDALEKVGIKPERISCFADGALMWLFGLERKGIKADSFGHELMNNRFVKRFLDRPVCDYLRE